MLWDCDEWSWERSRVVPPAGGIISKKPPPARTYQTFGFSQPRGKCVVDGCTVTLPSTVLVKNKNKSRVCDEHKRAIEVSSDGFRARYCQQCLRIHVLKEFDGERRACRKRLNRHRDRRARRREKDEPSASGNPATDVIFEAPPVWKGSESSRDASDGSCGPKELCGNGGSALQSAKAAPIRRGGGAAVVRPAESQCLHIPTEDASITRFDCRQYECQPTDAGLASSWEPRCSNWTGQTTADLRGICGKGLTQTSFWQQEDSLSCPSIAGRRSQSDIDRTFPVSAFRAIGEFACHQQQPWEMQQDASHMPSSSPASPYPHDRMNDELLAVLHGSFAATEPRQQDANTVGEPPGGAADQPWEQCMHATMKMADITPEVLPSDLSPHVNFILEAIPIDIRAAMRPGCVHLSLDVWFSTPGELQASKAAVQQNFVDITLQMGRGVFWARQDTHVLLPYSQHRVSRNGELLSSRARVATLRVESVSPVVINPWTGSVTVLLRGMTSSDFALVCRLKGRYYPMEVLEQERHTDGSITCEVELSPCLDECGLAWVEVFEQEGTDGGGFPHVSASHPLLLTEYNTIAPEVSALFDGFTLEESQQQAGLLKASPSPFAFSHFLFTTPIGWFYCIDPLPLFIFP
mmetsp:Transcript_20345/g.36299  ORF Transcript_20345/g.36299 Transcript_20345/m.36299 type:complete len:635 (-) Transcript_20345:53-1957(-)